MIPKIEQASTLEIKAFQEGKLVELLAYLNENSAYYKTVFSENNIDVHSIKTLEDLTKIPTTTKDQLQQYNDDFLCVPKSKIIDYVTTSGTLGDPVTFALTDNDLERLAYNEAISFACAGVNKEDVLQLMTTIDRRFMAGLAYFLGVRKLGAGIIRVGAGIPELQWDSILKFKPSYLIAVPSFLLKLIEHAEQHDIDLNNSGVKGAICIGEPLREQDFSLNSLSQKIKAKWNIELYSTYASTEMNTAFTECEQQQGGHHHPELIIVEILDEKDNPVAPGEVGELTISTLGVEGMPLLRFKTGDMVSAHKEACSCGRNTLRLGPVVGRKKQMIKYKGTTLYPPAMNNILNDFNEVDSYIIEISHNEIGTDEILIKIAAKATSEKLLQNIKDHFRAKLRVAPKIEFHDKKEIQKLQFPKMSRKPILVIDKRV
ncbi:phenylacetate--CoA ligase family protein [Oceanihabitans sediminis]|uniref:Phenylacetate--CoA ligase family protein n=1 Tax=Oceanihabitans sediminis TaxID=1812012 RepID=A0A368P8I3_9FLAO|nr:AMP-binding protein [Oceanihabitans sediminis]MDX1278655.1 AMP-binding protein [Oceanihabitans sediminis]MDX1772883.1 AMP-binding protein [Oceanihabitans sediminis]RBP34561.1 phenylacetate-CoA ligase [Oceanihabitans sediminis]RCU58225.1 phenylacetate--CoA ligase family protein [Oceanihabitans sediminis]